MKRIPLCFVFILLNVAGTDQLRAGDVLVLYKPDSVLNKYVLRRDYQLVERKVVSEVIIADTFSIKSTPPVCHVAMSNAYVLQTIVDKSAPPGATNSVEQNKMLFTVYRWTFPRHTILISNTGATELWRAKVDRPDESNVRTYEGDAALRELKRLGLKPPDDMK